MVFRQIRHRHISMKLTSLHLSETKTAVPGPTLHRLPHQDLDWAPGSGMDLVVHHMLETLVIGRTQEDLSAHLASRVAGVHYLKTKGSKNG